MKRRDFYMGLTAGSVLLGMPAGFASTQLDTPPLPYMQQQAFTARLQQTFRIQSFDGSTRCKVQLEVVDSIYRNQQFIARFVGHPQANTLREDMYLLTTEDNQDLLLHLQPSAAHPGALDAVINLTVSA